MHTDGRESTALVLRCLCSESCLKLLLFGAVCHVHMTSRDVNWNPTPGCRLHGCKRAVAGGQCLVYTSLLTPKGVALSFFLSTKASSQQDGNTWYNTSGTFASTADGGDGGRALQSPGARMARCELIKRLSLMTYHHTARGHGQAKQSRDALVQHGMRWCNI